MNNMGIDLKVRVGERPSCISIQDQGISNVGQPGVIPHNDCARLGGFKLHTSRADAVGVTEP